MQVTETSADGLKREYRIVIPAGDIDQQISRRLSEIGQSIRIPGFRPGKVPMQILQRRYGPAVRGEVLEQTLQESSAEAMREQNLRPALQPRVEILSATEGADLEYTMAVEILPEMPQPDFSGLGLEKLVAEVPEDAVERSLTRLAEQQRKSEPVEREAASGDILVVDMVGRMEGEELPGSRGENREIELGEEGLLPGFSDQLIGAKAGDQREVKVTFPEEYGAERAGKEATFDITVKEVREKKPTAVDDELAKAVGLETLDELRDEIRQRMQRDYEGMSRNRLKRALLDKLAEQYDFPVPPGMVEMEFNSIWSQYQNEKATREQAANGAAGEAGDADAPVNGDGPVDGAALIAPEESALEGAPERAPATAEAAHPEPHQHGSQEHGAGVHHAIPHPGSSDEPIDGAAIIAPEESALEGASDTEPAAAEETPEDAQTREEYRRLAERRVRLGLLLAEVGRSNNITVSQEELNQALIQEAQRHRGYERQVFDYYRNNPDAVNNLRAPIFEEKVVDFIVGQANVGERKVPLEELLAEPDDDAADSAGSEASSGAASPEPAADQPAS